MEKKLYNVLNDMKGDFDMKNTIIKIFALTLVVVLACAVLVSCGKTLSGEYTASLGDTSIAGTKTTYKFSGKNVTITNVSGVAGFEKTTTFDGKYEIFEEDGNEYIQFTFEGEGSDYSQKMTFAETEEGIKLNGVEYKKK
jgi:hypothetical protein